MRIFQRVEIFCMVMIAILAPSIAIGEVSGVVGGLPELKGLYLGMNEADLVGKMPEFKCHAPESWSGYANVLDRICDAQSTTIAGQPASAVALFLSNSLESVTFHPVASASFPIITDTLIQKYGTPTHDETALFVTRGGDSAKNRWLHWKLKDGNHLVAREHFNILNSPGVRLLTPWAAMSIKGFFLAPPLKTAPISDL